jgi:ribosomal protein L11 methyltransferase
VIEIAQEQAEAWSALFDLGALSVSVEDADADTPDEQPLFGEPGLEPTRLAWNRSRVVALFDEETDPALVVTAAANALVDPVPPYELRGVEDQDWVRLTQSQFEPIRIGERIWVVPSWHEAPDPDAVIPGARPGPGIRHRQPSDHAPVHAVAGSQRACRRNRARLWLRLGILAIVAKKLGAGDTVGIDIDPNAVDASRYNAERNRVEASFALSPRPPTTSWWPTSCRIRSLMAAMSARVRGRAAA